MQRFAGAQGPRNRLPQYDMPPPREPGRIEKHTLLIANPYFWFAIGIVCLVFLGLTHHPAHEQHRDVRVIPHKPGHSIKFRIALVADLDHDSKYMAGKKTRWRSYLQPGHLIRDEHGQYSVDFSEDALAVSTKLAEGGRGMELSELVHFRDRLITMDDRTGTVFEIINKTVAIPRAVLMDGDGNIPKGFKGEWATVKDGQLYIGGMGKEWTNNDGVILNSNPCWVKVIDNNWSVKHVDWSHVYQKLRQATGHVHPGYMLHEAVSWHPEHRKWYFLPRRASMEPYNEVVDETKGANIMLSCDENFENIQVHKMGPLHKERGFSSFKFVPDIREHLITLKSQEVRGKIATFISVMDLSGRVLMDPVLVGDIKYEGIEFLWDENDDDNADDEESKNSDDTGSGDQ